MNAPSGTTRFLAFPPVALIIVCLCGLFVWHWYLGDTPWPVGVIALVIVGQVFKAIDAVSKYKAWCRAWEAMDDKPRSNNTARTAKVVGGLIAGIVLVMISQVRAISDHGMTIAAVSIASAVGILIVNGLIKMRRKRKAAHVDVVSTIVATPRQSATRSDVMRELPEYSARILSR